MSITKEELRQIVREEIERVLTIYLDAKSTAHAMEKGNFYTAKPALFTPSVVSEPDPSPSHNKPARQKKLSS